MHFGGAETTVAAEQTQQPPAAEISRRQDGVLRRAPGHEPPSGQAGSGWRLPAWLCLPWCPHCERGKKHSSAACWKSALPLWGGSWKNAARVENSTFCMEMGAPMHPVQPFLLRASVQNTGGVLLAVLPLSFLLTLI